MRKMNLTMRLVIHSLPQSLVVTCITLSWLSTYVGRQLLSDWTLPESRNHSTSTPGIDRSRLVISRPLSDIDAVKSASTLPRRNEKLPVLELKVILYSPVPDISRQSDEKLLGSFVVPELIHLYLTPSRQASCVSNSPVFSLSCSNK